MLDRFEVPKNEEVIREQMELASWAWNSHWWVESYPGYYECRWCKMTCTSVMGIDIDFPLCKENYAIKKLERGKKIK